MNLLKETDQDFELYPSGTEPEPDVYVLPATPSQMRFWSVHQLHPENHALNMPLAWTCRGKLDRSLVATALALLVHRHEVLHTTFDVIDGKLSQIIRPPVEVPVPLDDLSDLPSNVRTEQASALIRKEARIHMDMKKGPLFFARLIRMNFEESILLITMHHSICDGWSNGVLLRDFAAIYDGLARKIKPALPELAIQFGDYAVWLEEWRESKAPADSLEFWRETLGGDFTPLAIQRDLPGGHAKDAGEIETLLLPPELAQQARDFCTAEGVTLYMLLFSVFAATLYRVTLQGDFLIGSPCANRRPETEELIGTFANPQVMRVQIESADSFGKLLHRVRDWTLGALAHQDLPFEDLIDDPFFSEERNRISLQVYFLYQKAFMQAQHTVSLDITPLRSVSPGTSFDLMLSVVERTEGPRLQLEYNPGYFSLSTIQRFLRLYVQFLQSALADAAQKIEKLHTIEEEEYRIELGEIEAALAQHPAVRDAVVVAVDGGLGRKRLAAYVDSHSTDITGDLPSQLRYLLSARLPNSMIPAVITPLQSLPRTPNGKIDRKALPAPRFTDSGVTSDQSSAAEYVAPRTSLERHVAELWERTLGIKKVGIRSSFFDLGGHSLAAMRIVNKINKTYSLDFGLATLFSGETVERMAELIENRVTPNTTSSIVPMQPLGSAAPLFIIHGAGGNILRFYPLAMLIGTDHPIYGVQAQSLLSGQPALLCLKKIASYYLQEIRKIQPTGPYYFLGYSFGGTVALEMAQQLRAVGEQVGLLGMLDARQHDFMTGILKNDSMRARLDRRLTRFAGNIDRLSIQSKFAYLWTKFRTRTLRSIYAVAAALGVRSVPSFMKSAEDISYVAAQNYRQQSYPGDITIFRATEQPDARLPRELGWKPLVQGEIEIYELPGDHDRIFLEPNIRILAKQLHTCLQRKDAEEARSEESASPAQ